MHRYSSEMKLMPIMGELLRESLEKCNTRVCTLAVNKSCDCRHSGSSVVIEFADADIGFFILFLENGMECIVISNSELKP